MEPGHAQLRFHQLPILAGGPEVAEAAECAAAQGHFWEFYDYTFENWNANTFTNLGLKDAAETIGLDTREFNRCLDTHQMRDYVESDLESAQEAGFTSTPIIVIGQTVLPGLRDYEEYRQVTIDELARAGVTVN